MPYKSINQPDILGENRNACSYTTNTNNNINNVRVNIILKLKKLTTWTEKTKIRSKNNKIIDTSEDQKKIHANQIARILLQRGYPPFANSPGDLGSIPGRVIPKTLKMELDTTLLNTQHYKVRFKGKVEQSWEWSSALPYTLV